MASHHRRRQYVTNGRRHNQDVHIKAIMQWRSTQRALQTPDDLAPTCQGIAQDSPRDDSELSTFKTAMTSASEATSNLKSGDDEDGRRISKPRALFDIAMPTAASHLTPFAYQQALANRVEKFLLERNQKFDVDAYMPLFVHDVLMLPGSLANLLCSESSTLNIRNNISPALLPGFSPRVHSETKQPRLVPSQDVGEYVQGMIVFGQSKEARRMVHQHYRLYARRTKVNIETEVIVGYQKGPDGRLTGKDPLLKRKSVRAYAWVWKDRKKPEAMEQLVPDQKWSIDDYMEGKYDEEQTTLRVDDGAKGDEDEDGFIGREIEEREIKPEEREEVLGGTGALDYDRGGSFTGW